MLNLQRLLLKDCLFLQPYILLFIILQEHNANHEYFVSKGIPFYQVKLFS